MRSEATVSGDDAKKKTASDFMNLYRDDWNDRISAHAISTLDTHNYNKPKLLPLTSDIIKLQQYQIDFIECFQTGRASPLTGTA